MASYRTDRGWAFFPISNEANVLHVSREAADGSALRAAEIARQYFFGN